ncbi:flagellar biosynthesis repressor FlbT [Cohaesibacter haloalkalitolerans]|uniref:flagellar biosynthesis repressor FlbT n=1 Tax=Cohaesibacter haloalkalitolerans TaxID=1162980 RepID=UPI000E65297E|nr:flagellar biosynthesis repressor FlbT [Cohaesibacter haloalkalitolerans]
MKPMRLTFKSGERFYINGAVIRFPKKTTIELLNEAEFLLENHIIQPEETTTPLRQLYFIAQMMFTSPTNLVEAHGTFLKFARSLTSSVDHYLLCAGIQEIVDIVNAGNYYEAMKRIRELYPLEDSLMSDVVDIRDKASDPHDHRSGVHAEYPAE